MSALKEIKGIEKRLVYKQKLLLQAETAKRYDSCEGILKEGQGIKGDKPALENELHALCRNEQKAKWYQKKRATRNKFSQKLIQFLMIQVLQLASQVLNLIGPTPLFVSQAPHFGQVTHPRSVQHPISSVQHPTSRSSTPSRQRSLFSQPRNLSCQSSTASHKSSAGYISSDDSDRPLLSPPSCSSSHVAASWSASVEILSDDVVAFLPQPPSVKIRVILSKDQCKWKA